MNVPYQDVFTVIGIITVAIIAIVLLYVIAILGTAILLAGCRKAAKKLSKAVFKAGGGRTHQHPDGEHWPKPPYDRIWLEIQWFERCLYRLGFRLGLRHGELVSDNPWYARNIDFERLQEVREENGYT